jgi:hypothetical protein
MQAHHMRTKIATLRQREQADDCECEYLDQIAIRGWGADDYVDHVVELAASRRSYEGGDDRELHRVLSYAGLAPAYRRY